MEDQTGVDIDIERIGRDAGYRREQARTLLASAGDVDHVELRRVARQIFPRLARPRAATELAQLIGAASTMQRTIEITAITAEREEERRRREDHTKHPPLELEYPDRYTDLDDARKNVLIRFCAEQVEDGAEGREALALLQSRHGWPYSDRTFYVGPWKAARLRRRKRHRREEELRSRDPGDEGADSSSAGRMAAAAGNGHASLGDGNVVMTTDRASYQARQMDDGDWEVRVRARLDPGQMRKLHSEAIELFFGSVNPLNGSAASER